MSGFQFLNSHQQVPDDGDIQSSFTIKASAGTDLWETLPSTRRFNAPILYRSMPLSSFRSARVTILASWEELYDQGGLVFVVTSQDGTRRWIKAGVEVVNGQPHLSIVAKDRSADWCVYEPVPLGQAPRIEMIKENDGLCFYLLERDRKKFMREVTWVFSGDGSEICWVGTLVARPSSEGGDLSVTFKDLDIEEN
jgi:regulation of enolase protein 1 (concanavalin A-like superfamily)